MTGSSTTPLADVELVLDVRELRTPPDTREEFAALWEAVEPALIGRNLRRRRHHELSGADGTIRLEVARLADGLTVVAPQTRFSVVAVREPAKLRYRCKQCAAAGQAGYAPFSCQDCKQAGPDHRVCDRHVSILDGALVATCREHHPSCSGCTRPATFRCAGRACRRDRAWCHHHRRAHPRDSDVDYCPTCYDTEFPRCEVAKCADIGTVACEHISASHDGCARRMCTRHARRWQVFGAERLGLGRCAQHVTLAGLVPDQLLFQIVLGACARHRRERLPSLQAFAHTLRNCEHRELALDYRRIHQLLGDLASRLDQRGPQSARDAMAEMRSPWDRQLQNVATASQDGERLIAKLKTIILAEDPRHGAAITSALSLAEYKPPITRDGVVQRQAKLFVNVPENLRGLFIGPNGSRIRGYRERLGVEVQIEGGQRRK